MLFFIDDLKRVGLVFKAFKYISCYSLSQIELQRCAPFIIQIHLMLFFIAFASRLLLRLYRYSNTSHVILYQVASGDINEVDSFKYISCYSLSERTKKMKCTLINSNTSHVILYPRNMGVKAGLVEFKYISCYSLSGERNRPRAGNLCIQIHLMLFFICTFLRFLQGMYPFKYISCYSLSVCSRIPSILLIDSNTSHVILYRLFQKHLQKHLCNSNTSHVILYPGLL